MELKESVFPTATRIVYFPSKSEIAPVFVPSITTVAPGRGALVSASEMVPERVRSCPKTLSCINNSKKVIRELLSFCIFKILNPRNNRVFFLKIKFKSQNTTKIIKVKFYEYLEKQNQKVWNGT